MWEILKKSEWSEKWYFLYGYGHLYDAVSCGHHTQFNHLWSSIYDYSNKNTGQLDVNILIPPRSCRDNTFQIVIPIQCRVHYHWSVVAPVIESQSPPCDWYWEGILRPLSSFKRNSLSCCIFSQHFKSARSCHLKLDPIRYMSHQFIRDHGRPSRFSIFHTAYLCFCVSVWSLCYWWSFFNVWKFVL